MAAVKRRAGGVDNQNGELEIKGLIHHQLVAI